MIVVSKHSSYYITSLQDTEVWKWERWEIRAQSGTDVLEDLIDLYEVREMYVTSEEVVIQIAP